MQAGTGGSKGPGTVFINGKFTAHPITGVERVATEMVRALDRLGPEKSARWVLLCPPGGRPPALGHIEVKRVGPPGLSLRAWEQTVLPWAARHGLLLNLSGSAPYFAREQACYIHDAAIFDVPQAYTALFRAWYRRLFRRHVRQGSRLFTVSAFSRERLSEALETHPHRITVVPNGGDHLDALPPDLDVLNRLGLHGQPFFLTLTSGSRAKNLAGVLAAFSQLRAVHTAHLVVVGRPNRRVFAAAARALEQGLAASLAPHRRVVHAGAISDAALKALMGRATALVFPSLYEGFGLPALEAMACGCPVLASNVAALPEVCGPAALYADPESVADIAQAMQRLLTDPALRDTLREAGAQRVQGFRWAESARQLLEALGLQPSRLGVAA